MMGVGNWSELELIALFKQEIACDAGSGLVKGIGDDCAVFENLDDRQWLTTTDILVEHVHFECSWHPPRLLGRKSMAVNFSDIAAMGGTPHFALLSVALPASIEKSWIMQWYAGVGEMLKAHDCRLIGGDTAKSEVLTINVVVIGSAAKDMAVMRNTARAGENIYVSGPLGSAGAGLEICRNESLFKSMDRQILASMQNQHLDPQPEIRLGVLLGKSGMVGAMQDLSDGLATDMAHIGAESGVGAEIDAHALPAAEGLEQACRLAGKSAVSMQVSGGEDYRLLFTVKKTCDEDLLSLIKSEGLGPVYRIGRTVEQPGVRLLKDDGTIADISFQGYQHAGASR